MSVRIGRVLTISAALAAGSGCEVQGLVLLSPETEEERDGDPSEGEAESESEVRLDGGEADAPDGGPTEICNGVDDNGDGVPDEGFDLATDIDNCGTCGNACVFLNAFAACEESACVIERCADFYYDLDGDLDNGCEYGLCIPSDDEIEICNGDDDDCDGLIDEGFDLTSDDQNCNECENVCAFSNAVASCEESTCVFTCLPGFLDRNVTASDGCEYACPVWPPVEETCNLLDDDCDGVPDDGQSTGGACGSDVGDCEFGVLICYDDGSTDCLGETSPADEVCDGRDNDCDGAIDDGGLTDGSCGTDAGECVAGTRVCVYPPGEYRCLGATAAATETCNGLDDDCDGRTDEDVANDGSCGSDEGECVPGTRVCNEDGDGAFHCLNAAPPSLEICDGLDNDCDGDTDETFPESGDTCGTTVGECTTGTWVCEGLDGLDCSGDAEPADEVCDGLDNDCDGTTDEDFPEENDPCGLDTGECEFGSKACAAGAIVCPDDVEPTMEVCNGRDDNCNGTPDDGINQSSPQTCGPSCTLCDLPFAIEGCDGTGCTVAGCQYGHYDIDPDAPGCEYACIPTGGEICDGVDNDCDGDTDADDASLFLSNPCLTTGECAGAAASCTAGAWVCGYGANVEQSSPGVIAAEETRCDGLDNDCDGQVDESWPVGDPCSDGGIGACASTGTYLCAGPDAVSCSIDSPGAAPAAESCNGLDDDCDGFVDENSDGPALAGVSDTLVRVVRAGLDFYVYEYEASRPGASSSSAGTFENRACSKVNVLPWASVSYAEAGAACAAAQMRLCTGAEWSTACAGAPSVASGQTCDTDGSYLCYPYGDTYGATTCNGNDYDTLAGAPDDDAVVRTGLMASCTSLDSVNDLSGNLKEWTNDPVSTGYRVRGGSYDNVQAGLTCDFDATVLPTSFLFPNLGFRCCCTTATAPATDPVTGASCPP